jgi:hypothetical protein
MPYLFAYLLYYVTKWPVNAAVGAAAGEGLGATGNRSIGSTTHNLSPIASHLGFSPVPCLLHIYWALHAIHIILAGVALWSWWTSYRSKYQGPSIKCQDSSATPSASDQLTTNYQPSPFSLPASRFSLLTALAPWLLLALIFYIPGVYLEWPSDPWEHLRRINEWRILDTVGAHSTWLKSSYFIPYSLLSWCIGLQQLFWLDFYYTGICLLLCWQYYRFARTCGLGERASMVFVIIQALLFGNNIFSFYRYYGISSSIYAQLGAVALTRIVLEFAASGTKLVGPSLVDAPSVIPSPNTRSDPTQAQSLAPSLPATRSSLLRAIYSLLTTRYSLLLSIPCLLALTAMNHPQGLGIAALGIAAVCIWRLIEWKHSALLWLIGGTLIINALFLWLYPRPAIIETYRAQGYLNSWYGFNVLNLTSPAGDRMLQIVSAFGLGNLAAALFLRRNHVIAWLTATPVVTLSQPCFAIPFSIQVNRVGGDLNVITFQRLLFAIPIGLALVCLVARLTHTPPKDKLSNRRHPFEFTLITSTCLILAALTTVPSSQSTYNRIWNTYVVVADDLRLRDIFNQYAAVKRQLLNSPESRVITVQAGSALLPNATDLIVANQFRMIGLPAIDSIVASLDLLGFDAINTPSRKAYERSVNLLSISNPSRNESNRFSSPNLITDSRVTALTDWVNFGGHEPELISGILDLPNVSTALQNPIGVSCQPFTSKMIPVQRLKSYRLDMAVKQVREVGATVLLAVAWYDGNGGILTSYVAKPQGAGNPSGWRNGTYSYFGLVNDRAPTAWTRYSITFGLNGAAAIPPNARFLRVGALLNFNVTSSAVVQLADVRMIEIPTPKIGLAIPSATSVYTPVAQASLLSTHWPPQQVLVDRGGTKEILTAAAMSQAYLKGPSLK